MHQCRMFLYSVLRLTGTGIYLRKCGALRGTKSQGTKLDSALSTLKVTVLVVAVCCAPFEGSEHNDTTEVTMCCHNVARFCADFMWSYDAAHTTPVPAKRQVTLRTLREGGKKFTVLNIELWGATIKGRMENLQGLCVCMCVCEGFCTNTRFGALNKQS
jgi:hypothetical protein